MIVCFHSWGHELGLQKRWAIGILLVVSLLLPGITHVAADYTITPVDTAILSPEEQALWQMLAAARASSSMNPLTLDANADALARDRSTDMATRAYFDHTNPDGKTVIDLVPNYGIAYHAIGEIIAFNLGVPDSGSEAAKGFIASPVHHAIFFNSRFTTAGVGHAVDATGKHYFTVVLLA